jgi:hypothetical protein
LGAGYASFWQSVKQTAQTLKLTRLQKLRAEFSDLFFDAFATNASIFDPKGKMLILGCAGFSRWIGKTSPTEVETGIFVF